MIKFLIKSLNGKDFSGEGANNSVATKCKFFRVTDIFSESSLLDKIEPADIKQGCLGDCYFLSVLSVLSEDPSRIRRLFITEAINEYGIYAVNICKNG